MSTALAQAFRRAAELQRTAKVRPVVLVAAEPVRAGVARRLAADAPLTLRPISILRPERSTPAEIHSFALEQFPPAARRLAIADPKQR